jgi:hypothetical protein
VRSNILILGDKPDWFDILKGRAFATGYKKNGRYVERAGDILNDLLTKNSIRPTACRMSTVWLHAPKKKEDCDFSWHVERAFLEIVKVKYVLLQGTLAVALVEEGASAQEWSGLEMTSTEWPTGVRAMGSVIMKTAFTHLGEAELALKRFGEMTHET